MQSSPNIQLVRSLENMFRSIVSGQEVNHDTVLDISRHFDRLSFGVKEIQPSNSFIPPPMAQTNKVRNGVSVANKNISKDEFSKIISEGNIVCCYTFQKGKVRDTICGSKVTEIDPNVDDFHQFCKSHSGKKGKTATKAVDNSAPIFNGIVSNDQIQLGFSKRTSDVTSDFFQLKQLMDGSFFSRPLGDESIYFNSIPDASFLVFKKFNDTYFCVGKILSKIKNDGSNLPIDFNSKVTQDFTAEEIQWLRNQNIEFHISNNEEENEI